MEDGPRIVNEMGRTESEDAGALSPRAERKCAQLLDGARAVILARGFEGASVDDIAREAGISKATMYRYYPDKAALFAAVMQRDCSRTAETLLGLETEGRPIEDVLIDLGRRHVGFILTPNAVAMFRTAVAESERFPEVGQAFYGFGIDRSRAWLAPVLAERAAAGELAIDDPDAAAHQFFALCHGDLFFRRLFHVERVCCGDAIDAHVRTAVRAFLGIYRPEPSAAP